MCQLFEARWAVGYITSPERVTADPEKLEAAQRWPQPTDKYEVRRFHGLYTYHRRFIAGLADIDKPLIQFTEED
jgi:hypothetical protein